MKPFRILLFFVSVVILLLAISLVFPAEGIRISDDISLKYFKINDLLEDEKEAYADITTIIENASIESDVEIEIENDSALNEIIDNYPAFDTVRADPDSLKRITHLIEFHDNDKECLYGFFGRLRKLSDSRELLRVLHYGDSQIETDRITGFIRNRLQKKFGGSGPGLIPAIPLYKGKMSIRQDFSGPWKRVTGFGNPDTTLKHNRFGALISYCTYDTCVDESEECPSIEFKPSSIAYNTAKKYNVISAYMGKENNDSLRLEAYANDSLIDDIRFSECLHYNKLSWTFDKTPEKFSLKFIGNASPEIYALSLDNSWGIAVDNIPLRGSAGLVFSKIDTSLLRKMYGDLNIGLILLQFGGNVVPYLRDFEKYESVFERELTFIRSICPKVAIVVIGPSDMSYKEKNKYVTYENLEKVRDALKNASMNTGCGFWDMYEAMGGRNSMPSWVFAEPSLAISDFVHFNSRGAKIMAEMMYNAIIYEYNLWLIEKG